MLKVTTSRLERLGYQPPRKPIFGPCKALLTLLLISAVAFQAPCALADPTIHIYIYEDGIAVDETPIYSYSESHVISLVTEEVVGESLPEDPDGLYDADGQLIGYITYEPGN